MTMSILMTQAELFALGVAYGSFSIGEIDQGIHAVLPVRDSNTQEPSNYIFKSLFLEEFDRIDQSKEDYSELGDIYMKAIRDWASRNGLDIGRNY